MVRSMTGFGKASGEWKNNRISVEIRSLNSKQLDLNLRIPNSFREKEPELRGYLTKTIGRGRVDVSIHIENASAEAPVTINKDVALEYYKDLRRLSKKIGKETDYLSIIMKMPDVLKTERPDAQEGEWEEVMKLVKEANNHFSQYRGEEGKALEKDFRQRIKNILSLLNEIENQEPKRISAIKERIKKNIAEVIPPDKLDSNRFEQELIYYLEKIDITEEKVRLKTHCNYFLETMSHKDSEGRKLGFITQEIGREINTIGSKANDAVMQKSVVQMKDELEKIKEQALNVL